MLTVSYLVHYDTLLQNATDIITKYVSYYKISRFYYKMLLLLYDTMFIKKCVGAPSYGNNFWKAALLIMDCF